VSSQAGRPLNDLSRSRSWWPATPATTASGEINSQVDDTAATLAHVRAAYEHVPGVAVDRLDGLSVDLGDGRRFNLRPSNTEPLLRLNVEAPGRPEMAALRDEVLALIR